VIITFSQFLVGNVGGWCDVYNKMCLGLGTGLLLCLSQEFTIPLRRNYSKEFSRFSKARLHANNHLNHKIGT